MRTNTALHGHGRISLYDVEPRFVRALEPMRTWLEVWDVQPATVALLAIPIQVAAAGTLLLGALFPRMLVLVPLLAVAWMGLNGLDGSLARSTGRSSLSGTILSEIVDRVGDVMMIVVAFLIAPVWVSSVLAVGVLGSELVALTGWAVTGERNISGPMGRLDRAAVLSVGAVAAIFWYPSLVVAFAVIGIGSLGGALVRTRGVLRAAAVADVEGTP